MKPHLLPIVFLLATTLPVQAQWVNYPKTVRLYDNATGKTVGTVTVDGNTAYYRNKDGQHYATGVRNPDGTNTFFDSNGNIIGPIKLPSEP
jgi:hypothetical protein